MLIISLNFFVREIAKKPAEVNRVRIVRRVKKNMFGKFNEANKPKTSFAKYSVEFNDFVWKTAPHRRPYVRLLGRFYTLIYMKRLAG